MQLFPYVSQVTFTVRYWHEDGTLSWFITVSSGQTPQDLDEDCSYDDPSQPREMLAEIVSHGRSVIGEIVQGFMDPFADHPAQLLRPLGQ